MNDKTEYPECGRFGSWPCEDCNPTDWEYEYKQLEAENKKLREALEFYAEEENWAQSIAGQYNLGKIWISVNGCHITLECGARARAVLAEIKEGSK